MPLVSATTSTVVLSEFTRTYVASLTSFYATSCGSYSVKPPYSTKYCEAHRMHSSLENRSKRPSEPRIRKSSTCGSKVVILISGSFNTKSRLLTSFVTSSVIFICLHSKSPNARVIASLPRTLPKTMYPPYYFILSYSSFLEAF